MKPEEINRYYFSDVNSPPGVNRRDFLKKLGGGIIIVFSFSAYTVVNGCLQKKEEEEAGDVPEFNAYLRVKEDGTVDCYSGKIEMGQGINTSLSQILADELEVPFESINMIMGETSLVPYDAGTWGSMTTRFHDPLIRAAAAEAREVLKELASEKLQIPVSELKAQDGKIISINNPKKNISYAKLTIGKKIVKGLGEKIPLKKPGEFKVIGKPFFRRDAVEKVTGVAKYTADVKIDGMLYARIVRPPAHGSTLIFADTSEAESMEGVEIFREEDFIVVLHSDPEAAMLAADKVKAEWKIPDAKADDETIFEHIKRTAVDTNVRYKGGDLKKGKKESAIIVEEEYHDGYKAHASIETHAATAVYNNEKLTIYASSQTPFGTRQAISERYSIPLENVLIKQIYIGGGFGGKIYDQQAREAARIAIKKEGTPIQLMWNRQEEFMYDMFRPAAVVKVGAGMDKTGKLNYWNFEIFCAGDRGTELFYDIPNHQTTVSDGPEVHPFGTGAWRAPGNPSTTFARESHIDIMASKINMDPLEFRLKNMNNQRALNSLQLAAKSFDWNKELPEGHGKGIAVGEDAGTLVTVMVEVKVDKSSGQVQVIRAVVGQDMGQVINPQGTIIQAEGCVNMGLGYTLSEDVEFNWKTVKSKNFDDYQITHFSTVPETIETVLADAMDQPPQGGGEPAIICMGAAVANAVFDACGARVFRMPVTPERVLAALA
ncbi:MAG: xanthine dehydrogenase family protein molybdopterin-binding subunit [Prolixibacteraceae bacterium]|nr:xanthine dehydrogenase family protein molybdopterin-binding subunit [Prolixibacteraceae bacterium]